MKNPTIKITLILLAATVLAPIQAFAWGRSHHRDPFIVHHPYPTYGRAIVSLQSKNLSIVIGGLRYYYCDGVFYRRHQRQYVVVAPPAGAVVTALPAGFVPVVINGVTYYVSNGVYYQYTPNGYVVVPQPGATVMAQAPVPGAAAVTDTFPINLPNTQGGYTTVIIKRSKDGYVGPQGEFYPEFPKIEQLKAMYGKT